MADWVFYPIQRTLVMNNPLADGFKVKVRSVAPEVAAFTTYFTLMNGGCSIDWGDGTVRQIISHDQENLSTMCSHAYPEADKEYVVTFYDMRSGIYFEQFAPNIGDGKIIDLMTPFPEHVLSPYDVDYGTLRLAAGSYSWTSLKRISAPGVFSAYGAKVTTANSLFQYAPSLTYINPKAFSGLTNVTSLYRAFTGAYQASQSAMGYLPESEQEGFMDATLTIPETLFDGMRNLESVSSLFEDSFRIRSIPQNLFTVAKHPQLNDFSYAFQQSSFEEGADYATIISNGGPNSPYYITGAAPKLWEMFPYANGEGCFRGCYGLSNYQEIPDEWK